jgi:dolichol-phosphate mannosyltransferase
MHFRAETIYLRAMNQTLIIIPTYNESANVEALSSAILRLQEDVDILFVDDNSPDGTGLLCDRLAEHDERINVIHRENKKGLGRAYIEGFKWALARDYEIVFEMDCDFSHHPEDIETMRMAVCDADLVIGSRYLEGIRVINWPLGRLMLSKAAAVYVKLVTGMPFDDPTGGFKCYRREVLESIDLDSIKSNGYSFQVETAHRAWIQGFKVVEIPITFEERRSGESKMSSAIVAEAFWMVWKILFTHGMRRSPRRAHPLSIAAKSAKRER